MTKCPKCRKGMVLHESLHGALTWACYNCGQIGLSMSDISINAEDLRSDNKNKESKTYIIPVGPLGWINICGKCYQEYQKMKKG